MLGSGVRAIDVSMMIRYDQDYGPHAVIVLTVKHERIRLDFKRFTFFVRAGAINKRRKTIRYQK